VVTANVVGTVGDAGSCAIWTIETPSAGIHVTETQNALVTQTNGYAEWVFNVVNFNFPALPQGHSVVQENGFIIWVFQINYDGLIVENQNVVVKQMSLVKKILFQCLTGACKPCSTLGKWWRKVVAWSVDQREESQWWCFVTAGVVGAGGGGGGAGVYFDAV
jgi:hypothetical protein